MALKSKIEWTEATWNPVTGCTKVSEGCKNCYAERLSKRLNKMGVKKYYNAFELTIHPDTLEEPLKWKKPQMIFVNSMSDLFHEEISLSYIQSVFNVMNKANWHQFLILTKRGERLYELNHKFKWTNNIWMGVTVESNKHIDRIDYLRKCNAKIKFLSLEPLLTPIHNLDLNRMDWVIVGGESGVGARPIKEEWVIEIKNICSSSNVPFFFKQWGGVNKKSNGRLLEGRTYDDFPVRSSNIQNKNLTTSYQ